jgi:putative transposase
MPRDGKRVGPLRYGNSLPDVIRPVVLTYARCPLSLERGGPAVRARDRHLPRDGAAVWNRFGPMFAGDIRPQRVSRMRTVCHRRRHLDEMYLKLNGETVYLWRAVDHEGEVLESYVTNTRDKGPAAPS